MSRKTQPSARETFEAALVFRTKLRQEYLKSIHSGNLPREMVDKAERELLKSTYNTVSGMTPEQEELLSAHEEITDLIQSLAKYL
jgi:hypothetical protein